MKLGIYIDFGSYTCGGYAGSEFYLQLDAQTFRDWGIDSVKMDGCNSDPTQQPEGYATMAFFFNQTGRQMYFSCSYPAYILPNSLNVTLLQQTCNSWRMFDDMYALFLIILLYYITSLTIKNELCAVN